MQNKICRAFTFPFSGAFSEVLKHLEITVFDKCVQFGHMDMLDYKMSQELYILLKLF